MSLTDRKSRHHPVDHNSLTLTDLPVDVSRCSPQNFDAPLLGLLHYCTHELIKPNEPSPSRYLSTPRSDLWGIDLVSQAALPVSECPSVMLYRPPQTRQDNLSIFPLLTLFATTMASPANNAQPPTRPSSTYHPLTTHINRRRALGKRFSCGQCGADCGG